MNADLQNRYPGIADLRARARRRIPHFSWEYLDSGTGLEHCIDHNINALQAIKLMPHMMQGKQQLDLKTELFGISYNAPFGLAPVGLTGLMWPGIETMLSNTAARYRIPYCLSTVATETPETIGAQVDGCLLYTSPSPRDQRGSRMPSSA